MALDGVKRRPEEIQIFHGREEFRLFYDHIYNYVTLHGGDICVSGVDERLFVEHQGNYSIFHMDRMAKLVQQRKDIHMKILVREEGYTFRRN